MYVFLWHIQTSMVCYLKEHVYPLHLSLLCYKIGSTIMIGNALPRTQANLLLWVGLPGCGGGAEEALNKRRFP